MPCLQTTWSHHLSLPTTSYTRHAETDDDPNTTANNSTAQNTNDKNNSDMTMEESFEECDDPKQEHEIPPKNNTNNTKTQLDNATIAERRNQTQAEISSE